MKNGIKILAPLALALMLATVPAAFAANTAYTNTSQTVTQTQWRANAALFGTPTTIDDSGPYYTYVATGNAIHETFDYQPAVTNQAGGNHVYTYSRTSGDYVMHSGIISYTYHNVTNYNVWTGYLSFSGMKISSANTAATGGQLNQWVFVYLPGNTAPSAYPDAVQMGSGYWLVGFSAYTYGSTPAPDTTFPGGAFWTLALNPPHLP